MIVAWERKKKKKINETDKDYKALYYIFRFPTKLKRPSTYHIYARTAAYISSIISVKHRIALFSSITGKKNHYYSALKNL